MQDVDARDKRGHDEAVIKEFGTIAAQIGAIPAERR